MIFLFALLGAALACGPITPDGGFATRAEISLTLRPSVLWSVGVAPGQSGANDVKEAIMDGMEVSLFRAIASNAVLVTEKEISYEITGLPVTGLLGTCGTKIGDDFPTLQDENGFLDECDPTDPPAHVALELSGTIFIELTEPVTEIVFAEIIDDFLINLAKRSAKTDGITIKYFA